jgi:hypothetical protein
VSFYLKVKKKLLERYLTLLDSTFSNRLFSILLAIASFRFSGRFLERTSFCCSSQNVSPHTLLLPVQIQTSGGVCLLMLYIDNKFVALPVSDSEHGVYIQPAGRRKNGQKSYAAQQ